MIRSQPQTAVMKVSAIVPAYNEAERIGAVLEPLKASKYVDEIIVVDDGSTDDTAQVARSYKVKVLSLPQNVGKAEALNRGVRLAKNDVLLFLDADLIGLRPEHIKLLIETYRKRRVGMVIGRFKDGRLATDLSMIIAPYLSGQRVLSRALFNKVRKKEDMNFGLEIALTKLALKEGLKQKLVTLEGVAHVMKEEKRGFSKGLKDRMRMYGDVVKSIFTKVS